VQINREKKGKGEKAAYCSHVTVKVPRPVVGAFVKEAQ